MIRPRVSLSYLTLLALSQTFTAVITAPTGLRSASGIKQYIHARLGDSCSIRSCLFGNAYFDIATLSCACPKWKPPTPCADLECRPPLEPFYSFTARSCFCEDMDVWLSDEYLLDNDNVKQYAEAEYVDDLRLHRRQIDGTLSPSSTSFAPVDTVVPTFIPPLDIDVTPELIQQSLTLQPQNNAIIAAVTPNFLDGTITFHVQLDGLVADTIMMNATTSLVCDSTLLDQKPDVILVPKTIKQGTSQTVVAACTCIAVNMYDAGVITYWIQTEEGTIYSLVGENKVLDINKIDTNGGAFLSMLLSSSGTEKRELSTNTNAVGRDRRQVFEIACGNPCPFYHMSEIEGSNGYCGCVFNGADEELKLGSRGIAEPNRFNAKMSPTACAAMICTNNGNRPAMFNPFTSTCWCNKPPYAENNPSAWTAQA